LQRIIFLRYLARELNVSADKQAAQFRGNPAHRVPGKDTAYGAIEIEQDRPPPGKNVGYARTAHASYSWAILFHNESNAVRTFAYGRVIGASFCQYWQRYRYGQVGDHGHV
jgi:hypothetical protein